MTDEPDQESRQHSIFEHVPEQEWDEEIDDDPGEVAPPLAVDMDILVPVKREDA